MSADVFPELSGILDTISNGNLAKFTFIASGIQILAGLFTGAVVPFWVMWIVMGNMKKAEEQKETVRLKEKEEDRAMRLKEREEDRAMRLKEREEDRAERMADRITVGFLVLAAIFAIYLKT